MLWFFIVSTLAAVSALPYDGACPNVKLMENFDYTRYLGTWYEHYVMPEPAAAMSCTEFDTSVEGANVSKNVSYIVNEKKSVMEGTFKVTGSNGTPTPEEISNYILNTIHIVATDYTSYVIEYVCYLDESTNTHGYVIFVSLRSTEVTDEVKNKINYFFQSNIPDVDLSKFTQISFTEEACKYTSVETTTVTVQQS